jgi:hypothetical protein
MAAVSLCHPVHPARIWIAILALTLISPPISLAQGGARVPDTAQAVRWLDAAHGSLDPSAEDLRVPLALAYTRALRPRAALALSHAPAVLAVAACAAMTAGDTAASDTTFLLASDEATRGWLLAKLARRHLRVWWNKPPTADRVARSAHVTDRITWPDARVGAELFLAYHLIATAHDTLAARARLAGTRASYAAITDPLRRVEYASNIAWMEASIGDPAAARRLAWTVPEGGDRTGALSRVAAAFRARGLDPLPTLLEAESLARARRNPAARARALDLVIMGYDSVSDSAAIRRLRALRPSARPPLPLTRLDSARRSLEAGDTSGAELLVRTFPDPRSLGYRAAAMEALGLDYRREPASWGRAARLYRDAVVEARRIRDPNVRLFAIRGLAWMQEGLGSDSDTRRLPETSALQDSLLRDAEVTSALLPADDRVPILRALVTTWGLRAPAEARRLLGQLPTRSDSAEALKWMAIKIPTSKGLDSLRAQLNDPLAALTIAGVLATRPKLAAGTTVVASRRALLETAVLPRDTTLVRPLLASGVATSDTAWLTAWAAQQTTSPARVAAYRELGLQSLVGGGAWLWLGRPETCLDE